MNSRETEDGNVLFGNWPYDIYRVSAGPEISKQLYSRIYLYTISRSNDV